MVRTTRGGILTTPGVRRLVLATFFGRIAASMVPLALLIVVEERSGSFAFAGVVAGAVAAGSALGGAVQARLFARFGTRRVLKHLAAWSLAALIILLAAINADVSPPLVAGLGILAGATRPYTASVMRIIWTQLLEPHQRMAAEAFEATAFPVAYSVGPVVLAIVMTLSSVTAAVLVAAAIGCIATAVFADSPLLRRDLAAPIRPSASAGIGDRCRLAILLVVGLQCFAAPRPCPLSSLRSAQGGSAARSPTG